VAYFKVSYLQPDIAVKRAAFALHTHEALGSDLCQDTDYNYFVFFPQIFGVITVPVCHPSVFLTVHYSLYPIRPVRLCGSESFIHITK
jgi:hypothetical protein